MCPAFVKFFLELSTAAKGYGVTTSSGVDLNLKWFTSLACYDLQSSIELCVTIECCVSE